MQPTTLTKAVRLADEFLVRAKAVQLEAAADGRNTYFLATRKTGALRRASMELTRVLADLRNNR